MNTEKTPKTSSARFERTKNITKKVAGGIAATAALGAGLGIGNEIYERNQYHNEQDAAIEIAQRFTDCHIESFTDTRTQPKAVSDLRMSSSEGRTTIRLQISAKETEAALSSEAPYENNDRVYWLNPMVQGAIIPNPSVLTMPNLDELDSPKTRPNAYVASNELAQMTRKGGFQGTLEAEFYPRTNYPDGKEARIVITQEVSATDDSNRRFEAIGFMDCGKMVFDGATRTWKLVEDQSSTEPVVKQYEDTDGDSMWNPTLIK